MIPNHNQFLEALGEKRKVRVKFYSPADGGLLDRVCAPVDYGLGGTTKDALNRYWLWDYASDTGSYTLGLVPQQIVDLKVLGEKFDPAQLVIGPGTALDSRTGGLPLATAVEPAIPGVPKL